MAEGRTIAEGAGPPRPVLEIAADALEAIHRAAEAAWPLESCGVLVGARNGDRATVARAVACPNAAPDARARYEIAPGDVLRAERAAREEGLRIVGFFHSHADAPAVPSPVDLEEAAWDGHWYVIVEIARGRAADARAYALEADATGRRRFVPGEVRVTARP